jgi:myo-inositol-1(or 4)-monophosphatase
LDPIYLATAVEAALASGAIQRRYFRQNPDITKKGRIDLVTAADLEVERAFRTLIAERFPGHTVLGEEAGASAPPQSSRFRWIIDPVDGTTNFAHGLAVFCVSIALEIDGRLDVGVVYDPMADELFTAERGGGARLNGRTIQVAPTETLVDALMCTGFPYSVTRDHVRQMKAFVAFLEQAQGLRRLGSAALDMCYVAAGRFDGFWEERLHPWDIAAGVVIIEEAGGRVSGYSGGPLELFSGEVVASNGGIHDQMLQVLAHAGRLSG